MAFDLEGLPDSLVHAQLVLHSNAPLPAHARRLLIVDVGALSYCERPDVGAHFGLILAATLEPVTGLLFTWLAHRARPAPLIPAPTAPLAQRYDEQRLVYFQLENTTNADLSLPDSAAVVTLVGIPLAVRPGDATVLAPPALPAQDAPGEIQARSSGGVTLSQNWFVLS